MPDTTVLEVRGPSSPQARTVELGAPSVRIGRGPQCEVRLGEPSLAEVQCLLRRRGDTWHIQPVGPPGQLSIHGRPVESQRPLPVGQPLRVGSHWLMLNHQGVEERGRPITVAVKPAAVTTGIGGGPTRSVEPAMTPRPPASKPLEIPSARLTPTRPDDRGWDERPLNTGIRDRARIVRPAGSPTSRRVRDVGPLPTTRPIPATAYESRAVPPSYPWPRDYPGRPESPPAPTVDRGRDQSPRLGATVAAVPDSPTTELAVVPASPPSSPTTTEARLGCSTVVREEPLSSPVEPVTALASLPGLEAWAAELLIAAQAAYPSPTAFPTVLPTEPPMDVEVIEPEPEPEPPVDPDPGPLAESGPIQLSDEPGSLELVPPDVAEPVPSEDGPAVDGGSATAVAEAPSVPVPQIAITFEQPPVGLHRYLASIRRSRRSAPDDPMARTVEAMPVVPDDRAEAESRPSLKSPGVDPAPEAAAAPVAIEPTPFPEEFASVPEPVAVDGPENPEPAEEVGDEPVVVAPDPHEEPRVEVTWDAPSPPVASEPEPIGTSEPIRDRFESAPVQPSTVEQAAPEPRPVRSEPLTALPPVAGEWPSARSILDSAARLRAVESPRASTSSTTTAAASRRSSITLPLPTVARPPAQWKIPGLFWVPTTLATLAVGVVGVWLSACQTEALLSAGPLADRAASRRSPTTGDQLRAATPLRLVNAPAWWNSPAESTWPKAWALDDGEGDPARVEAVREWLDRARATSPALPAVRYALVSHATADDREKTERWAVGMGRDVLSRTLLGRRLLAEGKTEAGRAAYREAIELACRARELDPPTFDDKETRRYQLPEEGMIAWVVSDLAQRTDLRLSDWLELLGDRRLSTLVAGRALKARGHFDGDRLLEKAAEPPAEGADDWDAAAAAEALALLSRYDKAETAYEEVLEKLPEGPARRILLHNLADVRRRLGDESGARTTLKTACGDQVDDAIGRRALRVIAEIDRARRGSSLAEGRPAGSARKPSAAPR